ncbi:MULTISPECIES: radical SAM family heme chaperone HemW [unclassified Agromyces]|uniref:radical SAM family heme chaperone HemW n=1 Tax=unclassified Agromyces TaxID=2639701 RepID=UPI003014AD94
MAGPLPLADRAPADGLVPANALTDAATRAFGVYVHVPFCRVRCGYCDFNTYTAGELRGVTQAQYADQAVDELRFAARTLAASGAPDRPARTVFFGGGTPTMLPSDDLVRMLAGVRDEFGIADGAEVTTEANPDSVGPDDLERLAAGGFTRVSFGMQSAVPHVLAALDRTHDPSRVPHVVRWARDAGLDVSLDLIYGTPGESLDDWRASVDAVLAEAPDHVSAYALIVEEGTKLARQLRRGELPAIDDDLTADMYELADERFAAAGYEWYEVSNWATDAAHRSRHNLGYWRGEDWWGVGPGAHSHVGGVRWWNAKHPAAYAERLAAGVSPAVGRETLDAAARETERVLLGTRIRDGLEIGSLGTAGRSEVAGLIADGLVDAKNALAGRLTLTRRGRLLADAVVRRLLYTVVEEREPLLAT